MRRLGLIVVRVSALGIPLAARAQDAAAEAPGAAGGRGESICLMIEAAARANGLPIDFFARVIWQESRFQPEVVGPLTRSGGRAQGIAKRGNRDSNPQPR